MINLEECLKIDCDNKTRHKEQCKEPNNETWEEYCERFDRSVLWDILVTVEEFGCSLSDLCHAAIRLTELAVNKAEDVDAGIQDLDSPMIFFYNSLTN